ncbi:TusE/DsrC/DsvC family sulfur relay protein [Sedimenticola selenatireducens]|jgi:tRNA 2-thiouridine synthesizing protein E|uniref:Sulfur relay protein DsrC n=1 Tax=Sedimenticola selenatireducens TaxID=191960 RepID=A0A557SGR4_9GAMM|nr:TusE/DsrC/DsvC family sulfur relay protein [Sedimenticola selenatireducens]TVO76608.1 sulfur relay protein DsrC [Sedimenticola selenatireducens]TVT64051.1 MAG: sulfur relay protein DsrC [Sedimenticola selenatireducens]
MSVVQSISESANFASVLAGVRFDEDGFLLNDSIWDDQLAETLAELEGVAPLESAHWRVIHFVRDRFLRLGAIPPMRRICRSSELSKEEVKDLFGGCLQVWRIAGLPNPGEEAKAYMG